MIILKNTLTLLFVILIMQRMYGNPILDKLSSDINEIEKTLNTILDDQTKNTINTIKTSIQKKLVPTQTPIIEVKHPKQTPTKPAVVKMPSAIKPKTISKPAPQKPTIKKK